MVVAASQVDVMNHGDFTLSVNNNTLQRSLKWDAKELENSKHQAWFEPNRWALLSDKKISC